MTIYFFTKGFAIPGQSYRLISRFTSNFHSWLSNVFVSAISVYTGTNAFYLVYQIFCGSRVGVRFWIMSNVRRNCVPIMDLSGGMMRKGGTTAIGDDVDGGRVMHTGYRKI